MKLFKLKIYMGKTLIIEAMVEAEHLFLAKLMMKGTLALLSGEHPERFSGKIEKLTT